MKISIEHSYLGQKYVLTFEADTDVDLGRYEVESRISRVMRRELGRFAEISAVALKDNERDTQRTVMDRRARRDGATLVDATVGRGGPTFNAVAPTEKGPAVTLGAGTKDPALGRIVHDGTEDEQRAKQDARQRELKAGR